MLTVYGQVKIAIDNHDYPAVVGFSNYPGSNEAHYAVAINYRTVNGTKQIQMNTGWGYTEWISAGTAGSVWSILV